MIVSLALLWITSFNSLKWLCFSSSSEVRTTLSAQCCCSCCSPSVFAAAQNLLAQLDRIPFVFYAYQLPSFSKNFLFTFFSVSLSIAATGLKHVMESALSQKRTRREPPLRSKMRRQHEHGPRFLFWHMRCPQGRGESEILHAILSVPSYLRRVFCEFSRSSEEKMPFLSVSSSNEGVWAKITWFSKLPLISWDLSHVAGVFAGGFHFGHLFLGIYKFIRTHLNNLFEGVNKRPKSTTEF